MRVWWETETLGPIMRELALTVPPPLPCEDHHVRSEYGVCRECCAPLYGNPHNKEEPWVLPGTHEGSLLFTRTTFQIVLALTIVWWM